MKEKINQKIEEILDIHVGNTSHWRNVVQRVALQSISRIKLAKLEK